MRLVKDCLYSSVGASTVFGITFYLAGVVDATPREAFGWRIVMTGLLQRVLAATGTDRAAISALAAVLKAE